MSWDEFVLLIASPLTKSLLPKMLGSRLSNRYYRSLLANIHILGFYLSLLKMSLYDETFCLLLQKFLSLIFVANR